MSESNIKNVVISASLLPTSSRRATRKSILPDAVERKKSIKNVDQNPVVPAVPIIVNVPKIPAVVDIKPPNNASVVIVESKKAHPVPKKVVVMPPVVPPVRQKGIIIEPPVRKTPQPRKTIVQVISKPKTPKKILNKTLKKTDSFMVPVIAQPVRQNKTIKHIPTKQRSIKLSTTAKRKRDAVEKIKNNIETIPIKSIKEKLVGAGLITSHSRAPDEVLRDMYKNHTLTGGVVLVTRPN